MKRVSEEVWSSSLPERSALREPKKRVLILSADLYKSVGGGQTTYRAIIDSTPDVQYYYFIVDEDENTMRPENAIPVPSLKYYRENYGDLPEGLRYLYSDYLECWQLARSFAEAYPGVDVDVVDTPDYLRLGLFIRSALRAHGVRAGNVSLALHGAISSALSNEWGAPLSRRALAQLRMLERLQYRAADSRYALSEAYADELTRQSGGCVANLIDPLLTIGPFEPKRATADTPPDLLFIGRRERRKGPDLFIDAVWSLDKARYGRCMVIGAESKGASGVGSEAVLEDMARRRSLDIEFVPSAPRAELDDLFRQPSIVVLPSRYDQFNLIALEALRLGAPTFVSENAGVARWLRTHLPELPELVFSLSGARSVAAALRGALSDYAGFRARLVDAVAKRDFKPNLETLQAMHTPAAQRSDAQDTVRELCHRLDSFNAPRELGARDGRSAALALPHWKRAIINSPLGPAAGAYHRARLSVQERLSAVLDVDSDADRRPALETCSERARDQLRAARDLEGVRQRWLRHPERTREDVDQKLATLSQDIPSTLVARSLLFRDMARLERRRGGDVVAATYCLRLMRWMGRDVFDDLAYVDRTFQEHGFHAEAVAARAMFGPQTQANTSVRAVLNEQYTQHKTKSLGAFEIFDDQRGDVLPRVSVIVSLYNAASKLCGFLRQLAAQPGFQHGDIDVLLVDSGSPTNEYEVFKAVQTELSLPVLYVRTADRETIQAAWNRGVQLARAPYLSFLGVDEGVHPDAYQILADALDANPQIDWVMADSVVTSVDHDGAFVSDVMAYDRRDYDQSLVYLDTCYLSWVGGLYRRSIHDRFGYYDERFRGAGDTEFKSRVLPHIRSSHIAQPLGLFLNYPEERTTQHPRAEIEDQRAWYLYRTRAGVAYVWDDKPIEEVEAFFRRCLGYRKSYCGHISTDFDMAGAVAAYMRERGENTEFAAAAMTSTTAMLERIRGLEALDLRLSPHQREAAVLEALYQAKSQEQFDQSTFDLPTKPTYDIFNDNRYEQHWYSWSGA